MSNDIEVTVNVTKKPKKETHVALVLDRSSSMGISREAALQTINKQIKLIKKNAKKGGDTYVSLILFNDDVTTVFKKIPAAELRKVKRSEYVVSGCTALRDAQMKAIKILEKSMDEDINQGFLVLTITDGAENVSETSEKTLKKRIKKLNKTNKWTFTYMLDGHTEDQIREMSITLDIPLGNFATYDSSPVGTGGGGTYMACSTADYMSARDAGVQQSLTFYGDGVNIVDASEEGLKNQVKLSTTTDEDPDVTWTVQK